MKFRGDFVTNSSSSSFILGRKSELNDAQKAAIIQFVEEYFLGTKIITSENSEEEIEDAMENADYAYFGSQEKEKVHAVLAQGLDVYEGNFIFECADYCYAELFQKIWKILETNGADCFVPINTSLDY